MVCTRVSPTTPSIPLRGCFNWWYEVRKATTGSRLAPPTSYVSLSLVFTSGIQPPLLELTLFAGRTAVMECLLQPLDPDEIESVEWRRFDGLPFSPDRVTFAGLFNTTLIIENVMPFVDTAQYTCLIITTTNMRLGVSYQLSIFGTYHHMI